MVNIYNLKKKYICVVKNMILVMKLFKLSILYITM